MQRLLILAAVMAAVVVSSRAQQTNTVFTSLGMNASPTSVIGLGPTAATLVTDSPFVANLQGFPASPVMLLFGTYVPSVFANFGFSIDVAGVGPAGVGQIVVNGWDQPNPGTWTNAAGSLQIPALIPACVIGAGGAAACINGAIPNFTVQGLTVDPTNQPFGVRSTGAAVCSVVNGYTQFGLANLANDNALAYIFPQGFTFNYYGTTYTSCWVGENGYVAFGPASGAGFVGPTVAGVRAGPPSIMSCFSDLVSTAPAAQNPRVYAQYSVVNGLSQIRFGHERLSEFGGTAGAHGGEITIYGNGDVRVTHAPYNAVITINTAIGLTPGLNIDTGAPPAVGQTAFGRDLSVDWTTAQATGPVAVGINRAAFELFTAVGTAPANPMDLVGFNVLIGLPNLSGILFQRDPTIPQPQYLIQ